MARKNLIGVSDDLSAPTPVQAPIANSRPISGFVPPLRNAGPVGGITKTLGSITSKMERAQDLEKQLAEGTSVVELDPATIDGSFVRDRLAINAVELSQLTEQIKQHGQQVPILVRPHPEMKGRYQVAYGHRRLAAVRDLGIKVKAVVRELTDDQLVVSQGQENNARTNLSYIERALFASQLEQRLFKRDIIMSALGVDKAALSKMLSVVSQVPLTLIEYIGPAPDIGRRRWMELAEKLNGGNVEHLLAILSTEAMLSSSYEDRFQAVLDELSKRTDVARKVAPKAADPIAWVPRDGAVSVTFKKSTKKGVIAVEASDGPRFAAFIHSQIESLYEAFKKSTAVTTGE
ncbi:plasmid partitioning protein RepB [Mycoplana dimorpha]|uniref:ParB family chromosome partitioning protein n=1 Tax=Mycoplana dimorpha TaxID=28320 RepID=A0A2T5ANR1_MYCDI|nr:plasmid partitioning protein RepB [Mycoplana dimorpha]PTM88384.1 ParB family chromosome partitioning protein [Mycoplana dimorpha]